MPTNHSATFTLPIHETGARPEGGPTRVDSPLNTSASLMADQTEPDQGPMTSTSQDTKSDNHPTVRRRRRSSPKDARPRAPSSSNGGSLRFFVVDHPTKLKDKESMRENRKHVMYNYLDKERKKPLSTDARVTGSGGAARKRKRSLNPSLPGTSENPNSATNIFGTRNISVSSVSTDNSRWSASVASPSDDTDERRTTRVRSTPKNIRFADDISPLVRGISGGFNNSTYLRTSANDFPPISSYIGSNLNPFDTWAKFTDPLLDIEELKWSCTHLLEEWFDLLY